jgi:F-type H+-transporting ATPase subunit a
MEANQGQPIKNNLNSTSETINVKEISPKKLEVKEEISLSAEPIYHLGSFTITNSLLNTWLVVLIIIALAILVKRKISMIPRGIVNWFEVGIEEALNLFDQVTGSREKSLKVFPLIFTFFIFILLNNWLGLIPGLNAIGYIKEQNQEAIFVPYFRGGTTDLNTTLALSLIAFFLIHVFGIIAVGIWKYFNKFINIKALIEIPKKFLKNPAVILINPIKFFVGLIEIVGEIAKVVSLSFRLFGNIFAGEVLLMSIALIFAYVVPIPFLLLEIIVGLIQALVFSMLTLVFLTIAMAEEEH